MAFNPRLIYREVHLYMTFLRKYFTTFSITVTFILLTFLKIYSFKFSVCVDHFDRKIPKKIEKLTNNDNNHIFQWIFLWFLRLLTLMSLCGMACIIALMESYGDKRPLNETYSVVDIGFILTKEINVYLRSHEIVHHCLAFLNTFAVYFLLGYTVIVIGYCQNRPGLIITEMIMFILRFLCGYLTQLPYSNEYLPSNQDFPDCLTNQFRRSVSNQQQPHASFFFFFSGHVALVSLLAIYFYKTGRQRYSYLCYLFNSLQIIRLLSTRGHYSIDLIAGFMIGSYMYTLVAHIDKYLASCRFIKYLLRKNDTKLN